MFWPHCAACGILVPQPGIEPVPPAVEAWSPNHWTAREVHIYLPTYLSIYHLSIYISISIYIYIDIDIYITLTKSDKLWISD